VIAAFHDAPLPAVLMGDLNTEGPEAPLEALRQDPSVVDAVGRGEGDNLSPRNLDWIFGRGLSYVAGGLRENNASDHRLAWAELAEEPPR
jgi:endonuclease/exonuclease/phosphatase family metal-dependent hydrolase